MSRNNNLKNFQPEFNTLKNDYIKYAEDLVALATRKFLERFPSCKKPVEDSYHEFTKNGMSTHIKFREYVKVGKVYLIFSDGKVLLRSWNVGSPDIKRTWSSRSSFSRGFANFLKKGDPVLY